MAYVYKEVEVWVDLDQFETDDLIEELKDRGEFPKSLDALPAIDHTYKDLVEEIYTAKHVRNQPYEHLLNQLIYTVLGKIV